MLQENVQLVEASLERFAATGEPPWDLLHDQVEVHDEQRSAGVWTIRDGRVIEIRAYGSTTDALEAVGLAE